eukprot:INCI18371.1.p1 GENE.INCI18371.1~~INCI18371.1.p1  ORF type:complete len:432 (+),score=51.02 INCI18371.1:572-1867(+)
MSVAAMATGKALRRRVTWLDAALFVAFVGLGLGSWIAVNGIFQELPVVALTAPPQFNISVIESYAALLVAGANAYPVLYLILLAWLPCLRGDTMRKQCVDRWTLVIMMLVLGAGSCGLLAVFWNFTSDTAFLFFFLIFQASGTDCMTSVLFYPICSSFPPIFISALIIGETGTSIVAAVLSAAQVDGLPDGSTRFGVDIFFIILAGLCVVSAVCAVLIFVAAKSYGRQQNNEDTVSTTSHHAVTLLVSADEITAGDGSASTRTSAPTDSSQDDVSSCKCKRSEQRTSISAPTPPATTRLLWSILAGQALISFVENGVLASISANTLAPYGNLTTHLLEVTQQSSAIAGAVATLVAFWKHPRILNASWMWNSQGGAWLILIAVVFACGIFIFVAATIPLGKTASLDGAIPQTAIVTAAVGSATVHSSTTVFS